MDRWDGISKVSFNFLYTLYIYRTCICTYIDNRKFSPSFLWVSKVNVKLGMGEQNFRDYPMNVSFLIFGSKSCLFLFVFNRV